MFPDEELLKLYKTSKNIEASKRRVEVKRAPVTRCRDALLSPENAVSR